MLKKMRKIGFWGLCAFFLSIPAAFSEKPGKTTGDAYPLDTCPVSGDRLDMENAEPVTKVYEGREIRFCCSGCVKDFEKDKSKYLKKVDEAIIQQQLPLYPMDKCVVSNEKLGGEEMGEPIDYVHNNRLIRFCCKMCRGEFRKDEAKYLAALNQAVIEKQRKTYPLVQCLVTGKKLEESNIGKINFVSGNRLFRFCSKDCIEEFNKAPYRYHARFAPKKEEKKNP